MRWAWLYFPAGVALAVPGARGFWAAWLRPRRDWIRRRGRWVKAEITGIEPSAAITSPPYWARSAQLLVRYQLAGRAHLAPLILQHTRPGDYEPGQELDVFLPASGRPRTAREPNYSEQQLGGASLFALLALLAFAAGIAVLTRGR